MAIFYFLQGSVLIRDFITKTILFFGSQFPRFLPCIQDFSS